MLSKAFLSYTYKLLALEGTDVRINFPGQMPG